ncbi:YciI family protein [Flavobacterium sp. H122]|uniref:YciI family protein n=1 Tax=Flavobacterium sp. H122 TaxID=2529860 RepID=UPI0010A9A7C0|nr:YciI family protein [Flavobacterium sp. H122]
MFIVSLTYKKDISQVEKFIEAHIQFLDTYYSEKKFIFSGRKNPRTGGIILVRDSNRETLEEIIKQDPFYQNQIADYDITEFIPTKFDKEFTCFIEQ